MAKGSVPAQLKGHQFQKASPATVAAAVKGGKTSPKPTPAKGSSRGK